MKESRFKDKSEKVLGALALFVAGLAVGCSVLLTGIGESSERTVYNSLDSVSAQESVIVNLNTATVEELKKLEGISDVFAQKIIDYREEFGEFETAEELMNISGIGEKRYKSLCNYIRVE